MLRIRIVGLSLLLGGPLGVEAQQLPAGLTHPDSLRAWQPGRPTTDTVQLKQLINGSQRLVSTNLDSARLLAQQAVALAWRRHQGIGLTYGLAMLASAHYYANELPAAQRSYELLLWAAQRTHRPEQVGTAYMGLGLVARHLDNWAGAEQYFVRAQRAFARTQPRMVEGELSVLANRAYNFLDIDSVGRARPLVRAALARLRAVPQARHPAKYHLLLGMVQQKSGQFDSATATYGTAARLARATHDYNPEAEALLHLGELALRRADYPLVLRQARRAEQLFHELGDIQEADAVKQQATALAALRQPGAYATLQRYLSLYDSAIVRQRAEAVANAQARFSVREQQARIRELEQQRRIAALEATQRSFRTRVGLATLAGLALLLAGLGWSFYRRRQAAREAALRTRLASDLHDDVGTLLTQISLESALLEEGRYTPTQQHTRLRRVAEASRSAARQMSDVVWSVDARNDSFASLLDRMHDHAHEVLGTAGIEVEFHLDPGLRAQPLPLLARQHLYLIFKEALHNVLKHAQATEVHINLQQTNGRLRLAVRDNGQGGPVAESLASHGLRNMRMRAEAVGGTVRYESTSAGFGVVAELPGGR